MRTVGSWFLALVLVCPLGCGSNGGSSAEDASTGDAGLSSDEMSAASSGGSSVTVNAQVSSLANDIFDFDPTINPKSTPSQNATAIGANVQASLGTKCGSVSVSGADITVSFGPPPGCTLASGDVISGTVDLAVTQSGATTTTSLTLVDVVSNGVALSGTASFATTTGTTFTVVTSITSGDKSDSAHLTVTGSSGSFSVSGTATSTDDGTNTALTFTNLTVTPGQCYASAGSVMVTEGSVIETLTFSSSTPETGKVSVTVGRRTSTVTLPAYGSCPTDAQSPDGGRDR